MCPPVSEPCSLEGMRLLMILLQVVTIPKYSAEDTVLVTTNASGEKLTVPVPRGTSIVLHTPGLHYNRSCLRSLYILLAVLTAGDSFVLGGPLYLQTLSIFERLAEGSIYSF